MFEVSDGVLAMTAILTNSITFNGTAEDLMMSMMSEE